MRGTPTGRAGRLLRRVPLAGSYPAAVAMALLALCPFLVLTTATQLFQPQLQRDLHADAFAIQLTGGLANAGYAFGAVAAADFIQRVSRRGLFLCCEAGFLLSSLLALSAPGVFAFATGMILQGVATGLLLVAALPPLVTAHGAERLPSTAAFVDLGLFGAVTLGPLAGGLAGSFLGWRPLYGIMAALAAAGVLLGLLAFEPNEPPTPTMDFDWLAIPLALGATVLPFFGASWLTRGSFGSPAFVLPVAVGLALVVVLVAAQYRKAEALMPVRLISHTLPVTGIGCAMMTGGAFTALLELAEIHLLTELRYGPLLVGLLVTGQLPGIVVAAWLFKRVLPTRWTPVLALTGLLGVAVGAVLLLFLSAATAAFLVPVASLFLGYGAGAGVAPGLFMAGLSVPSTKIGPTFALVELLRSEAAFLLAPVLLYVAQTAASLTDGVQFAVAVLLALTGATGLLLIGVYLLGGARPHAPDLAGWIGGDATAYHSPPLAATVREPD